MIIYFKKLLLVLTLGLLAVSCGQLQVANGPINNVYVIKPQVNTEGTSMTGSKLEDNLKGNTQSGGKAKAEGLP
jgi:hypothetical protein